MVPYQKYFCSLAVMGELGEDRYPYLPKQSLGTVSLTVRGGTGIPTSQNNLLGQSL